MQAHGTPSSSATATELKKTGACWLLSGHSSPLSACAHPCAACFPDTCLSLWHAVAAAGFVGEMRAVAMKLHTREQAPKEGGTDAPKRQQAVSAPALESCWGDGPELQSTRSHARLSSLLPAVSTPEARL